MRIPTIVALVALSWAMPVLAQAPAAGSGSGGPVGASVVQPTTPQGAAPPGTPGDQTAAQRQSRDAIGTAVIGKTDTAGGAVPGNTGGTDSGVRR